LQKTRPRHEHLRRRTRHRRRRQRLLASCRLQDRRRNEPVLIYEKKLLKITPLLKAEESFELINARLILLCRYLSKCRARPVSYRIAIRARPPIHRMIECIDHVNSELQHQRLIKSRQAEVALDCDVELIEKIRAQAIESNRKCTNLVLVRRYI